MALEMQDGELLATMLPVDPVDPHECDDWHDGQCSVCCDASEGGCIVCRTWTAESARVLAYGDPADVLRFVLALES